MRITTLLITLTILQVSAKTFAQKITLNEINAPLEKVISDIKKQSDYQFLFTQDLANEKITAKISNATIEQALKAAFEHTNIDYKIVGNNVLLKKSGINANPAPPASDALPPVTVTGRVVDELGNPMVGVTVKQKDKPANATATDAKGYYTLNVPDNNSILVFSYVGYEPQELEAKDIPAGAVITLKASINNLHEVVINKGYYKERQELTTGDESVIDAKTIEEQPVSDPIQALIGRVAGLNIQQSSGVPGSFATVRIRGASSIANGTAPLYVIDGVPYGSTTLSTQYFGNALGYGTLGVTNQRGPLPNQGGLSPFASLNPFDIESIEVLKDADATAIYGSRGANGVILITTKKGITGTVKVNVNVTQGIGQVAKMMQLMNTQQYLQMRHQAYANDGLAFPSLATTPTNTNWDVNGFYDTTRNVNWQKLLMGNTAHYTNFESSVSGGNVNTQFLIGGGYNYQSTVYPGDFYDEKASMHFNTTHTSNNKKFKIMFGGSFINDKDLVPQIDLASNIYLPPDDPYPLNPDGTINWAMRNGSSTFPNNPFAKTVSSSQMVTNNLVGNLELSYELLPGLFVKSAFSYNRVELNENFLTPDASFAPPNNTNPGLRSSYFSDALTETWNIEPQISYNKKLGKGLLNILLGTTIQQNTLQNTVTLASGFPSDAEITNPLAATSFSLTSFIKTLYRYNSLYGRLGYTWDDKYLLNITARRDGSSRFGPGNQWGNFGAIGAGWIFSKEKLFQSKEFSWLSFGKLRVSYGTTGNDQIPDYQYLSTYNPIATSYQGATILNPTGLANPAFAWEVVKKLETGIDLGFIQNRINLSVNYYRDRTGNQLVGYPLPYSTGFTTIQYNLPAVIQNTGLEIELNTVNIKTKDFSWATDVNFTLPQNKLVSYPGFASSSYALSYAIGQSIFSQRVYKYTGINPQTGLYTFATSNANGTPTFAQDTYMSQPVTQKYYGGVRNTFNYQNFSLDLFIQFVNQIQPSYANSFTTPGAGQDQPIGVLNAWTPQNPTSNLQRYGTNSTTSTPYGNFRSSDAIFVNGSFVRVKNVELSYRLPERWQKWAKAQQSRIFLQAQNLFTITNYIGLDPETAGLTLPPLRIITAGISASF